MVNIMQDKKIVKNQEVTKAPSKKELIAEIREKTGKTYKELDSLSRANKETIAWVLELIS
jgi:hypothetical protein